MDVIDAILPVCGLLLGLFLGYYSRSQQYNDMKDIAYKHTELNVQYFNDYKYGQSALPTAEQNVSKEQLEEMLGGLPAQMEILPDPGLTAGNL